MLVYSQPNELAAKAMIRQQGWQGIVHPVKKPVQTNVYDMAFSKKSPAVQFIPQINQAIAELKAKGIIQNILKNSKPPKK